MASTSPPQPTRSRRSRRWLLAGALAALILGVAAYLLISSTGDEAAALDYHFETPEFEVRFPAEPTVETLPEAEDESMTIATWSEGLEGYSAMYSPVRAEEMTIDDALNTGFAGAGGTVEHTEERPLAGGQARFGEGVHEDTGLPMWLYTATLDGDEGIFSLMQIGEEENPAFFDSFEISAEFRESAGQ